MSVTPEQILAIRMEVADMDAALPILSDAEITYYLTKNSGSIGATTLDAARVILMKLSQQGDTTVGILAFKGSKAASEYAAALKLMLRDPSLNPMLRSATGYFGGVSKSDMQANDENLDNNIIKQNNTYDALSSTNGTAPSPIY